MARSVGILPTNRFTTDDMCVPEEHGAEEAMTRNLDQQDDVMVTLRDQEVDAPGQERFYAAE